MPAEEASLLTRWYHLLNFRNVDLVGDFAGANLGAIEGDSLLLACFSDPELDFRKGFQLLHAVFLVERFLKRLHERRCNFVIVFIEQNKKICLPYHTEPKDESKFLLAREIIIRHLRAHAESSPNVDIWIFPRLNDAALLENFKRKHVYFLLCHDGSLAAVKPFTENSDKQRILRAMIRFFLLRGFYIGLLNELKWQDSRVIVEVAEVSREAQRSLEEPDKAMQKALTCVAELGEKQPAPYVNVKHSPNISLFEDGANSAGPIVLICQVLSLLRSLPFWRHLSEVFLFHYLLLRDISISNRRLRCTVDIVDSDLALPAQDFLNYTNKAMRCLLAEHDPLREEYLYGLADVVDGRIFYYCLAHYSTLLPQLPAWLRNLHTRACSTLDIDVLLPQASTKPHHLCAGQECHDGTGKGLVLPFTNSVFDTHLSPVRVVAAGTVAEPYSAADRIFHDLTHWHNHRKRVQQDTPPYLTQRLLRQNQKRMAEMINYAASLTNASGTILEPKTIVTMGSQADFRERAGNVHTATATRGGSQNVRLSTREALRAQIASDRAAKATKEKQRLFDSWKFKKNQLDAISNAESIEESAKAYAKELHHSKSEMLGNEIRLYRIQNLLKLWNRTRSSYSEHRRFEILALIVHLLQILASGTLTASEASCASHIAKRLDVPVAFAASNDVERLLSFQVNYESILARPPGSWYRFMLFHFGPYMERNFDAAPDSRVPFKPDGWQRRVLDELDADHSVFVVAPTSSGKTFISFYAMEKVLKDDDDGVLVYLAPTKALVNQIAAEVQARFSKTYPYVSQTVWALHTRDYRINAPARCQVLVTVPHILQIMLLSPENAPTWCPRLRRIIFDEIHTIGRAEDGLVWEQLLLLSPCPIIALSATVGNPEEFCDWLTTTQKSIGVQLTMVQHPHRYSELRKFKYVAPKQFTFLSIPRPISSWRLSVDGDPCFGFIHPVATLLGKDTVPVDLSLEPRDCYTLYEALCRHQSEAFPVPETLDPQGCLPAVANKQDTLAWERSLKSLLGEWMEKTDSPFLKVLTTLREGMHPSRQAGIVCDNTMNSIESHPDAQQVDDSDIFATTMPLLCSLRMQNALPAILFNYDRSKCDDLCKRMLSILEDTESKYKAKSTSWASTLREWRSYQNTAAARGKDSKARKKGRKTQRGGDEDDDNVSKEDRAREEAAFAPVSKWASFDPSAPLEEFSFANSKKATLSELNVFADKLKFKNVDPLLIKALRRGIAIHHAGCNRVYRQTVEMLFRRGYLCVVFATGTLALGINMPCVTTVFCGDSVFLTALEYRQASGRAGRRGFDLLGNVIFHHIEDNKICRLISSRLPDLSGHFPLTTTMVLRLCSLLHNSQESPVVVKAVNSLLSQPRIYLGGEAYRDQVLHHLRFSIEYLRRNSLLSSSGAPRNFAGIVCHLYYTENAAFSFHALLIGGYFHKLTQNIGWNAPHVLQTLMLVLANIFGRRRFRTAISQEAMNRARNSPSVVFLPPLPQEAATILAEHDAETKRIFENYVSTFVDQHMHNPDNTLPFTRLKIGGEGTYLPSLPAPSIRSAFTALSGHGDSFATVSELCNGVRSGVFLEEAVIPKLSGSREEGEEEPLNAYLYDFWKHQDLRALEEDNGIRKSDVWFLLNDFSLVLATIVTSLTSYVKGPVSDLEFLDLQGGGEIDEIDLDDETETKEDPEPSVEGKKMKKAMPVRKKKEAVADSWEDEVSSEEQSGDNGFETATTASSPRETAEIATPHPGSVGDLKRVLIAFQQLKADFDAKFRKMWA